MSEKINLQTLIQSELSLLSNNSYTHSIIDIDLVEQECKEFKSFINKNYNSILTEQFQINELTGWLKDRMAFIKGIAESLKLKIADLIKLFTNSKVYKFFAHIGWNLTKLFDLIKTGFKYYRLLLDKIAEFMSKNKVAKWTEEKLKQLDQFLSENPMLRKIAGVGVAALLVYIWFNMAFTGDVSYDFDMSTVLGALAGKFTLHTLFAGKEGTKLLLLLTTGLLGLSFPWPGPSSIKFISSMIIALAKAVKNKIQGAKIQKHD